MKFCNLLLPFIFLFMSCEHSEKTISAKEYQENLIKEYSGPDSPLKEDDLLNFKGLDFFPINRSYVVTTKFEKLNDEKILSFKTSKNLNKQFKKYGKILFTLQNKPQELFIYQPYPINDEYKNHLFLPFRDGTTGVTSYGAGRYIDLSIEDIKNNALTIDFNKSYNPYCAYSSHYNCPITPLENTVSVPVEAGIRYVYQK